jgi:hypothetical protein
MRPALAARPEETAALFVDHLALALATHVAHVYGGMRLSPPVPHGGLAGWQERRAKELLNANLNGGVALSDLARACDLSIRHFTAHSDNPRRGTPCMARASETRKARVSWPFPRWR